MSIRTSRAYDIYIEFHFIKHLNRDLESNSNSLKRIKIYFAGQILKNSIKSPRDKPIDLENIAHIRNLESEIAEGQQPAFWTAGKEMI